MFGSRTAIYSTFTARFICFKVGSRLWCQFMAKKTLPKTGEKIPAKSFHVSKTNMRADEPFGDSAEDKMLVSNLRRGRIVGPFKARPEGKGFGVYVGRRRFLGKKQAGAKEFIVGDDCLIEDVTDEEAREASLIENLEVLRKETDPIARAKGLNEIVSRSPVGLRGVARKWGIPPSLLSEYMKVLELSPRMQKALGDGHVFFTDALQIAKLKIAPNVQEDLAKVAETEGQEAFKRDLFRAAEGRLKRGIPKGVYDILRLTYNKSVPSERSFLENLNKLAQTKKMETDDCAKWALAEKVAEELRKLHA